MYLDQGFIHRIQNVKVPLLVMFTRDDPIIPIESIPVEKFEANPNVFYVEA